MRSIYVNVLGFIAVCLLLIVYSQTIFKSTITWEDVGISSLAAIGIIILMLVLLTMYSYEFRKRSFESRVAEDETASRLVEKVRTVVDDSTSGELSLPSLWAENRARIDAYHQIARHQAENSFKRAQFTALAGFGVVLIMGIIAALSQNETSAISAAAVGVAGAALSAYLGATFIKMNGQATLQLAKFSRQPFRESQLLTAERLMNSTDHAKNDAALKIILNGLLNSQPHDGDEESPTG